MFSSFFGIDMRLIKWMVFVSFSVIFLSFDLILTATYYDFYVIFLLDKLFSGYFMLGAKKKKSFLSFFTYF